jgi:histidinol-phosphate aminotransferase
MQPTVEQLIRPEIRALSAYHVPESAGLVKLDAMENPYDWPEALKTEWLEVMRGVSINRYPNPLAPELQSALRLSMGIPEDQGLLLGNGSDELIQLLALAGAQPGLKVLSLEPGFVMYRMIARFAGMDHIGVPLLSDSFDLDLPTVLKAIERERPVLTFVAYPNNPTGNLFDQQDVIEIVESAPGLVVVDEAYAPFTDSSFLTRLGEWSNLLVMRTVSKMGLAGLRLGYLAGAPEWLNEIDKIRLPYNINSLTQASAAFALKHRSIFDGQTASIRKERTRLYDALCAIDGLRPYPSEANFILLRLPAGSADRTYAGLKSRGVLVKNLHGAHPLLADCLRVTVGAPEENRALLSALKAAL